MEGWALFQKGKKRLIRIALETDQGNYVDVLVFAYKYGVEYSTDIEDDEEVRRVEIKEVDK